MRVIAHRIEITLVLVAVLASLTTSLAAQAPPASVPATLSALGNLATALSQNNAAAALQTFDTGIKSFGEIEANINALTAQNEVLCSIDVIEEKETDGISVLDVDWYMELKSLGGGGASERRRQRVHLQMRSFRGKWKIISIDPIGILDPVHIPSR